MKSTLHHVLRLADEIEIGVPLLRDAVPAVAQFDCVDRLGDQRSPDARGNGDRHNDRYDDRVVAGHLEDHDDSGQNASGPRANHRRHADDRGGRGGQAGIGQDDGGEAVEGRAERRAKKERGREYAARGARSEADGRREQLGDEQQSQKADRRHVVVEDLLDHPVADAVDVGMAEDMGEADHHRADDGHADDVLHVDIRRELRKAVFHEDGATR